MSWFRKRNANKDLGKGSLKVEGGIWKCILDTPNKNERDQIILNARTFDDSGTYTMRLQLAKRKTMDALKLLDYFEISDRGSFLDYTEIVRSMGQYYHFPFKREKYIEN